MLAALVNADPPLCTYRDLARDLTLDDVVVLADILIVRLHNQRQAARAARAKAKTRAGSYG